MVHRPWLLSLVALGALLVAPAPSAPQRPPASRPPGVVGLLARQYVYLVGAHDARRGWLRDESARLLFKQGTRFSAFDTRGAARAVTLGKVEVVEPNGGYLARTGAASSDTPQVAVSGVAKPVPRPARPQTLDGALYREAAGALLTAKGLSVPRARLTQHLRVDLNGDGAEEVLLAAHSRAGIGSQPGVVKGDYCLAAVRFVVGGKTKTVPLSVEVYRQASEGPAAPAEYRFLSPCDIDGDGRMEIVVYARQYESDSVEVFTFDGKTARSVLTAGWGV